MLNTKIICNQYNNTKKISRQGIELPELNKMHIFPLDNHDSIVNVWNLNEHLLKK